MFKVFDLGNKSSEDKLNHLKSWLEDEGYYSNVVKNRIIITDKPFKEACIEWLNKNYSGMDAVDSKDYPGQVYYRYKPKANILFHNKMTGYIWVIDEIWLFFENELGLNKEEIKSITEEWLSDSYNLNGIKTVSGYGYILPRRSI
jgi:hypothetical protein